MKFPSDIGSSSFAYGCQSEGEIGIPRAEGMKPFGCPEGCGATYVRWYPNVARPALKCVVQPYFQERA